MSVVCQHNLVYGRGLQEVLKFCRSPLWIGKDFTFVVLFVSLDHLLGYKPSDLIGKSAYSFCHAQDTEVIIRAYRICKSALHVFDFVVL